MKKSLIWVAVLSLSLFAFGCGGVQKNDAQTAQNTTDVKTTVPTPAPSANEYSAPKAAPSLSTPAPATSAPSTPATAPTGATTQVAPTTPTTTPAPAATPAPATSTAEVQTLTPANTGMPVPPATTGMPVPPATTGTGVGISTGMPVLPGTPVGDANVAPLPPGTKVEEMVVNPTTPGSSTGGTPALTGGPTGVRQMAPVDWQGPMAGMVSSYDSYRCGKSATAASLGLPGFILMSHSAQPVAYGSTDRKVQRSSDMVNTGFSLGDLTLWHGANAATEIYVAKAGSTDLFVYELSTCQM